MSVGFEKRPLGGEVGGEKEEDNVGEVGEARWGMSFLSLHLLLRLHHLRSTKLFGTLLTLGSWRSCLSGSPHILLSSQSWPLMLLLSNVPIAPT